MKKHPIVAMDLGGTNIRLGLVSAKGEVLRRSRTGMPEVTSKRQFYGILADLITSFIATGRGLASPGAVAVAFAGFTMSERGYVYFAPNVSQLSGLEVGSSLEKLVGRPVFVENDANCAALGEYWLGAGRGTGSLFLFTLGTGIGGGLVIDGKLWHGSHGIAGEVGHHIIDVNGPVCQCGNRGCLEAFASATAIVREYSRRRPSKSGVTPPPRGTKMTAKMIFERAKAGEPTARSVVARAAEALGVGIANIFNIVNPELILIGGGVSRAGSILVGPARQRAREIVFPRLRSKLRVKIARLGDDAGLLGAAYLAYQGKHGSSR
jgi:glucokinase